MSTGHIVRRGPVAWRAAAAAAALFARPLRAQSTDAGRPATTAARYAITGNVRSVDDARVSGAIIEILDASNAAPHLTTSGPDGTFRLHDVAAGTVVLRVRRVGFRPETLEVAVPQPDGGAIVVPMAGVILEQADGGSPVPRFRNAMSGTRRQSCAPAYWVDGTPLGTLAFDLDAISPSSIEGIEVYGGIATVPAALRGPSSTAVCGVIAVWTRTGGARTGVAPLSSAQLADLVESGAVFTADQVDEPATIVPAISFVPAYPDSLRKVGGRVVAEFVVDVRGEVEDDTIGFVSASRAAFTESVRAALVGLRFSPALRKGRVVRQIVQWPISFESSTAAP